MSTRKGGVRSRKPAHQNKFAFRHNKSSKKTAKISGISHNGLCRRCQDKIEWRKKFRKYKPLKQAKKCNNCQQKSITRAYHTMCRTCAGGKQVCAKCGKSRNGQEDSESASTKISAHKRKLIEAHANTLRERDKRSLLRRLDQGEEIKIAKKQDDEDEEMA